MSYLRRQAQLTSHQERANILWCSMLIVQIFHLDVADTDAHATGAEMTSEDN